jgi:hypothetical protein
MDKITSVPASEFAGFFGHYQMAAQRAAVAVSNHGRITGYFVAPDEYQEFKRFRESRRSFATSDLPDAKVRPIGASRMDARLAHRDARLEEK